MNPAVKVLVDLWIIGFQVYGLLLQPGKGGLSKVATPPRNTDATGRDKGLQRTCLRRTKLVMIGDLMVMIDG